MSSSECREIENMIVSSVLSVIDVCAFKVVSQRKKEITSISVFITAGSVPRKLGEGSKFNSIRRFNDSKRSTFVIAKLMEGLRISCVSRRRIALLQSEGSSDPIYVF